jgi:4-amino-4-deoxy-L-arabinose transferase-like glycosyltransferase
VAMTAFLLYRTVRYVEKPSLRNAALSGLAVGLMTLTRGWLTPVCLMLALFACTRFLAQPAIRAVRDLGATLAVGALITALWLIPSQLLEPYHQPPLDAWLGWNWLQLDWPSLMSLKFFFRVGMWFFWPAWPFAGWAVWAWRRQRGVLHIVVPLAFVVMGLVLTLFHPAPEQGQLLVLLPPLAIMAAFGLLTMKRGVINAIDWFSVMALTACAAVIWVFWFAKLTGWPAQAARNALKLVPGFTPELGWAGLLVALAATLGWFVLVHWRLSRRPSVLWRAVVLSSGGLTLIWILLMTLFLPDMNYSKSYASVARQIANKLPPGTRCIESNVGAAQRASFAYYAQLPFAGVEDERCQLLLLQDSVKLRDDHEIQPQFRGKQWVLLWEGRRPADREERFRLYRRAD